MPTPTSGAAAPLDPRDAPRAARGAPRPGAEPRHLRAVPARSPAPPRGPAGAAAAAEGQEVPPPSAALVRRLAVAAFEVLDGSRAVAQLGGWITEEVARELAARRAARTERRTLYHDDRRRVPAPGRVHLCRPAPRVAEAVVVLRVGSRATAVALRLEFRRERWRATGLTVL